MIISSSSPSGRCAVIEGASDAASHWTPKRKEDDAHPQVDHPRSRACSCRRARAIQRRRDTVRARQNLRPQSWFASRTHHSDASHQHCRGESLSAGRSYNAIATTGGDQMPCRRRPQRADPSCGAGRAAGTFGWPIEGRLMRRHFLRSLARLASRICSRPRPTHLRDIAQGGQIQGRFTNGPRAGTGESEDDDRLLWIAGRKAPQIQRPERICPRRRPGRLNQMPGQCHPHSSRRSGGRLHVRPAFGSWPLFEHARMSAFHQLRSASRRVARIAFDAISLRPLSVAEKPDS